MDEWAKHKAPLALMSPQDSAHLLSMFDYATEKFRKKHGVRLPVTLEYFENASLIWAAARDEDSYLSLSEETWTAINQDHLLPIDHQHQMFGAGADIQGHAVWENEENHLLLQLVSDDLHMWSFGDCGVYQFWMSPKDLANRKWDKVTVTFESH